MPLKLTLHANILIPEEIVSKEEFEEIYKDDREALIEFLDDEFYSFIESIGSADALLEDFMWIKDDEKLKMASSVESKEIH